METNLSSRTKIIFINVTLVITTLLVIAATIEIALRIMGFNPFGEFFSDEGRAIFIRPSNNPQRIYEATPNARGYGWETQVSINSHGFRDREYNFHKPADVFRIVVIGDSITFGNRLAPDENYPAVLESLYQNAGKNIEVLNLGLGGYDTLQEVATLADIGLSYDPDLVILGYCINDIGIASGNVNYIRRLQKYGGWMYRSRLAQFIRIQLDRIDLKNTSVQANRADMFAKSYQHQMSGIPANDKLHGLMSELKFLTDTTETKLPFTQDYTDENHVRRLRFALEQLHDLQQQNPEKRFDVLVVIFPFLLEDNDSQDLLRVIRKMVRYEATRMDFKVLDLYPTFSSIGLDKLMIQPDDGIHPNAEGHRITAESLFNIINTNRQ